MCCVPVRVRARVCARARVGECVVTDVCINRMACRCFWDSDTDNYAQETFLNVSFLLCTCSTSMYIFLARVGCAYTMRTRAHAIRPHAR